MIPLWKKYLYFFGVQGNWGVEQPDGNEKMLRYEAAMSTLEAWPQERGGDDTKKETASYPWSKAEWIICSLCKPLLFN